MYTLQAVVIFLWDSGGRRGLRAARIEGASPRKVKITTLFFTSSGLRPRSSRLRRLPLAVSQSQIARFPSLSQRKITTDRHLVHVGMGVLAENNMELITRNLRNQIFISIFIHLSGTSDSVPVGGTSTVWLSRGDYAYVKGATKPTAMALRLLDKLFTTPTLMRSTVNGTKEFAALDPSKITAIKGNIVM